MGNQFSVFTQILDTAAVWPISRTGLQRVCAPYSIKYCKVQETCRASLRERSMDNDCNSTTAWLRNDQVPCVTIKERQIDLRANTWLSTILPNKGVVPSLFVILPQKSSPISSERMNGSVFCCTLRNIPHNDAQQSGRKPGRTYSPLSDAVTTTRSTQFKKTQFFLLNFYLCVICIYKSSKATSLRLRQTVGAVVCFSLVLVILGPAACATRTNVKKNCKNRKPVHRRVTNEKDSTQRSPAWSEWLEVVHDGTNLWTLFRSNRINNINVGFGLGSRLQQSLCAPLTNGTSARPVVSFCVFVIQWWVWKCAWVTALTAVTPAVCARHVHYMHFPVHV